MTPIYLACNATTPLDPTVLDALLPYLRQHFGNPSRTQKRSPKPANSCHLSAVAQAWRTRVETEWRRNEQGRVKYQEDHQCPQP